MKKISRNPDVLWREEDSAAAEAAAMLEQGDDAGEIGTAILFSDGTMVTLNILGTEIWKRCEGKSEEELVAELLDEFDVEPDVLRQDVSEFLAELAERKFITYG
jgi:pyrroloquinoline quinone biosynthesis protein D